MSCPCASFASGTPVSKVTAARCEVKPASYFGSAGRGSEGSCPKQIYSWALCNCNTNKIDIVPKPFSHREARLYAAFVHAKPS